MPSIQRGVRESGGAASKNLIIVDPQISQRVSRSFQRSVNLVEYHNGFDIIDMTLVGLRVFHTLAVILAAFVTLIAIQMMASGIGGLRTSVLTRSWRLPLQAYKGKVKKRISLRLCILTFHPQQKSDTRQ